MHNSDEVAAKIHAWIEEKFPLVRERALEPTDSLLDGGIIDSMGVLEIVMHLESEFGILVEDDDMVAENFETINAIAAFANSKFPVDA